MQTSAIGPGVGIQVYSQRSLTPTSIESVTPTEGSLSGDDGVDFSDEALKQYTDIIAPSISPANDPPPNLDPPPGN